ncbi:MAG TPA: DUF4326 domain-containing protein [Devosia sp.]|jgi:hypothetical protein|nr:DUF4326 domain-containing protein [Devosia sp.]
MKPVRIVLSRKAGFDLQATSLALNGLPAQSVARPGPWGNPFSIAEVMGETGLGRDAAQQEAVRRHERWIKGDLAGPKSAPMLDEMRTRLGGRNLACWCRQGSPCHVDVLLRLAND